MYDTIYRIKIVLRRLIDCYYGLEPISQDLIVEIEEIIEELGDENLE